MNLALGTAGDRTDEILQSLGEIAGLRADHVVLAHKERYLRGRSVEDLEAQLRAGLRHAGVADVASHPTELAGLVACLEFAADGDVVAVMCHAERAEIAAWLREQGATPDDAASIRSKVVRARGEHDLEEEIEALWGLEDPHHRVEVARGLGAGPLRLLAGHLMPSLRGPVLVTAAFLAGQAVTIEATLTFLGLGTGLDSVSWGAMLGAGALIGRLPLTSFQPHQARPGPA